MPRGGVTAGAARGGAGQAAPCEHAAALELGARRQQRARGLALARRVGAVGLGGLLRLLPPLAAELLLARALGLRHEVAHLVDYFLLTTHNLLLTTYNLLLATYYLGLRHEVAHLALRTTYYLLHTTTYYYLLLTTHLRHEVAHLVELRAERRARRRGRRLRRPHEARRLAAAHLVRVIGLGLGLVRVRVRVRVRVKVEW